MSPVERVQILSFIAGVVGTFVAILAYRKSRIADEANKRYRDVQKELAEIQLLLSRKANVHLALVVQHLPARDGHRLLSKQYCLVVKNTGNVEARNIKMTFSPHPNTSSPPADLNEIGTISVLAPGIEIPYQIFLGMNETPVFDGNWTWENPDGTTEQRTSHLRMPI